MDSACLRQIRDRLPSLYRPETGDTGLLSQYLLAVAELLERVNAESGGVLQAHWFAYADQARFSPFYRRGRELEGKPDPPVGDPDLERFPYVHDLARLGSLLSLLPWGGPPAQRETVELYRQRIADTVGLYRNGLGTLGAVAAIVRSQLPDDLGRPVGLRDRPFTVEESPPVAVPPQQASTRGAPAGIVGPVMRWTIHNDGIGPAAPTVYVQGIAPIADQTAQTRKPLIELYRAGADRVRLGLAYDGNLADGVTLRLRNAYASWIGGEDGLRRALSSSATGAANPVAPGPWIAVSGSPAPGAGVTALAHSRDAALWAAVESAGSSALWRFDGAAWVEALTALPAVRCLAADGDDLLAGTATGLLRIPLHPAGGGPLVPAGLAGPDVEALLRTRDGRWWLGTASGAARLGPGDALEPLGPATPIHALHEDATGTVYLGGDLGLFQLQAAAGHWYWYSGESHSEQVLDWQAFAPGSTDLAAGRPFLPPVRSLRRGPDSSLWIGTDRGLARYRARSVGGLAYVTLLEAFPDVPTGQVFGIEEDPRGALWFATANGLFRNDGDWWRARTGDGDALQLVRLGRSSEAAAPVFWRFDRGTAAWQRLDSASRSPGWVSQPTVASPPEEAEAAVRALLWTDHAIADLGTLDASTGTFTRSGDAPGALRMRYKPDELHIVDGGVPALPRLPSGPSVWRYLSIEPTRTRRGARRAWTIEGRLLPPQAADRVAALEGRYGDAASGLDLSLFDDAVFTFLPAAKVWFAWEERRAPGVLVRLQTLAPGETIDPAVLDRVWQAVEQVRPAGARALLAVDEAIVRGT